MKVWGTALALTGWLWAAALQAQPPEERVIPTPAEQPADAPIAPTPMAEPVPIVAPLKGKVALLDDVPNYAEILQHQWSSDDVPPPIRESLDNVQAYGRLRELTQPQGMTLSEAIGLALAHNTDLEIARLGPLGARAQVMQSQAIFDPLLTTDVTRSRSVRPAGSVLSGATTTIASNVDVNGTLTKLLRTGGQLSLSWTNDRLVTNSRFISLRPQYTTDFLLSLNQPLLRDFGWAFTTLQVRIAKVSERSALKQYEATIANTVKTVEQAYWVLVQAQESISVQEQGLALAREVERQNRGKFDVGAAPRTAVLEAQADVARQEATLIQVQNARTTAADALRKLVNAASPSLTSLVIVEPIDRPHVVPYTPDLESSLTLALERRPELAAAKLQLESSGMQLKAAENQLLPRLDAVGQLGSNGLSGHAVPVQVTDPTTGQTTTLLNPFGGPYADALTRGTDGRYYSYVAGVHVEVPLANAQGKAAYAQSRVNAEQARLQLRSVQESVTLEVKNAISNLQTDLRSVSATRIARELAEENVRNQRARYDVGLATTKDLLDFQNQLTTARAAEIQALTTYNIDLAELRRVEGTLLESHRIVIANGDAPATPWWALF